MGTAGRPCHVAHQGRLRYFSVSSLLSLLLGLCLFSVNSSMHSVVCFRVLCCANLGRSVARFFSTGFLVCLPLSNTILRQELFDPENILNPGVMLNKDPEIHVKNLKPMPVAGTFAPLSPHSLSILDSHLINVCVGNVLTQFLSIACR